MAAPFNNKGTTEVATLRDDTNGSLYHFPFNINTLEWSYQLNSQSFDTIGGRVTQLLSVRVNTMMIQGEAGSRKNLINMYKDFRTVQDNQNQFRVPMTFSVPSRNLSYKVFLENFVMGWDITTVTYPYSIALEVDQDVSNVTTVAATTDAMNKIMQSTSANIGFSPTWTGLGTGSAITNLQYQDIKQALSNGIITKNK